MTKDQYQSVVVAIPPTTTPPLDLPANVTEVTDAIAMLLRSHLGQRREIFLDATDQIQLRQVTAQKMYEWKAALRE